LIKNAATTLFYSNRSSGYITTKNQIRKSPQPEDKEMIQNFIIKAITLFISTLLLNSNFLHADFRVPGMSAEYDGWKYIPILEDEEIHSIVVLSTDRFYAENIRVVWFVQLENTWQGYSWNFADIRSTLQEIKNTLTLDDESDDDWPIEKESWPNGTTLDVPREMIEVGVFADDPLYQVIASLPDPINFLTSLVELGWSASDAEPFRKSCRKDTMLSELSLGFLMELIESGSGFETISDVFEDSVCQGGGGGGGGTCTPSLTVISPKKGGLSNTY